MKDKDDNLLPNREYWQKYSLAEVLEAEFQCEYCQCLITNHSILELQTCLQELSKRDAKHTEQILKEFDNERH